MFHSNPKNKEIIFQMQSLRSLLINSPDVHLLQKKLLSIWLINWTDTNYDILSLTMLINSSGPKVCTVLYTGVKCSHPILLTV
jgi:hypothetical protein